MIRLRLIHIRPVFQACVFSSQHGVYGDLETGVCKQAAFSGDRVFWRLHAVIACPSGSKSSPVFPSEHILSNASFPRRLPHILLVSSHGTLRSSVNSNQSLKSSHSSYRLRNSCSIAHVSATRNLATVSLVDKNIKGRKRTSAGIVQPTTRLCRRQEQRDQDAHQCDRDPDKREDRLL
jgi:hypothetical protein